MEKDSLKGNVKIIDSLDVSQIYGYVVKHNGLVQS